MNRSPVLATASLLTALCWVLLALSGVLPTGRLFVMTLASFVLVAACLELGPGKAFYVYLGASVLSLLWPGLAIFSLFALCFGILPLLIFYLRSRMAPFFARLLTHAVMSLLFIGVIAIVGIDQLILRDLGQSALILSSLALLALQLFLLVYDYAMRVFIRFYADRIGPWIRRRG